MYSTVFAIVILLVNTTPNVCFKNNGNIGRVARDIFPQPEYPEIQLKSVQENVKSAEKNTLLQVEFTKTEPAPAIQNGVVQVSSAAVLVQENSRKPGWSDQSSDITGNHKDTNFNKITNKLEPAQLESGAVLRGVLVFVGVGVLFMFYVAIKTYRKNSRAPAMLKKYGVRTRRSDVEMTPLPLDEDEDDETVFDVGNVSR